MVGTSETAPRAAAMGLASSVARFPVSSPSIARGGGDDEPPRAYAEQRRERRFATREVSFTRRLGHALRGAIANLDLVQAGRVAHRDARVRTQRTYELEQRARCDAVEPTADLAGAFEARLDACAGPERFTNTRKHGAGVGLFAQVRSRIRAELSHALEEILLPRQQDHGRVTQRYVAFERA